VGRGHGDPSWLDYSYPGGTTSLERFVATSRLIWLAMLFSVSLYGLLLYLVVLGRPEAFSATA